MKQGTRMRQGITSSKLGAAGLAVIVACLVLVPAVFPDFLVYQFSPKVRQFIAPHFERIDRGFEWANVPPATLFWAWRDRS